MGIYFSKIRSLLEVKRKIDGQEEDLDEEKENNNQEDNEENNEPQEQDEELDDEDEHQADNSPSEYSMDVEDDETEEPDESSTEGETSDNEDEHQADNSPSEYSMDVEDDENTDNSEEDNDADDSSDGYSMDTEDDDSSDDTTDDDESSDDSVDTSEGEDELKSLENDMFKDISPEQMNIKILELKKQYLEVYTTVVDVLTRTNKIQKTTQNIKVLEFIINKLMELKDLIQFYLSNTFDTKTYMENMVNYQQYLVTLNTINRLLKEINVKKGK